MYAAAGGASLASRQARQRQRQQKKLKSTQKDLTPKQPQAKQFHNYTDPNVPRLSRVERGVLKPPVHPNERRHSTSHCPLKESHSKARIRESPSICIPVQPIHASTHHLPLSPPSTLVRGNHHHHHHHLSSNYSLLQHQLPQIYVPEDGGKLERRCSFVRQVEEVGKKEEDVLDRCNHICNFEIKEKQLEAHTQFYVEEKDLFGSLDYPFSECSQGRTAWQERERGRRCSLSEEARQHRIKQTEAHHRWMKRNRIHDTTYGGGSDDDEDFVAFHQSAAANALLYVGLGTTAIGSVIFFIGTGEKGFKTLELRLIGPTLMVAGLICCLIRVLLCACPTTCFRRKPRLKDDPCSYRSSRRPLTHRYPEVVDQVDYVPADKTALLHKHTRKKVSIVPPNYSLPSTSTSEFKELPSLNLENEIRKLSIPQIHLPSLPDSEEHSRLSREDSIIELTPINYDDVQSLSSNDESEGLTIIEQQHQTKLTKIREPALKCDDNTTWGVDQQQQTECRSETLSVVIERSESSILMDNHSEPSSSASQCRNTDNDQQEAGDDERRRKKERKASSDNKHSGIVLSPLQLGQ